MAARMMPVDNHTGSQNGNKRLKFGNRIAGLNCWGNTAITNKSVNTRQDAQ